MNPSTDAVDKLLTALARDEDPDVLLRQIAAEFNVPEVLLVMGVQIDALIGLLALREEMSGPIYDHPDVKEKHTHGS